MKNNEPIDARVRLAISQWPDDAPRGSVTTFCAEHQISRKTFYQLLNRARQEGQAAVLMPRTRRPKTSPTKITHEVKTQAVQVRAALEASGLDYGPISVHDKMHVMGLLMVPSIASLARIFREAGVARLEPTKKPRAAYRRFVYPAPNACWQLDATEYVLTGGRKCVIFQLEDDHSRVEVASHVSLAETSDDALIVFKKGVAAHGVPQKLLTDNGSALNPSRRGWTGQLVDYAVSLGVEPITGKPYTPTTQGKNERLHQTLFRWLEKQPLAASLAELQEQVDRFDVIYNTQRPHQGLPGRVTPRAAWERTPVAEPPRPASSLGVVEVPAPAPVLVEPVGDAVRVVAKNGSVTYLRVLYQLGYWMAGEVVHLIDTESTVMFFDCFGEFLIEYECPAPGVRYVGKGRPPGQQPKVYRAG